MSRKIQLRFIDFNKKDRAEDNLDPVEDNLDRDENDRAKKDHDEDELNMARRIQTRIF